MRQILIVSIVLFSSNIMSQTTCSTSLPFCTGSNYTFPASTNTSAPTGANFGCLGSQDNPAFYYCEIDNPGNMTITISSTPNEDIDFICWGPFTNSLTMCNNLTAANIEDCSYSPSGIETCQINGSQTGDFYVLLITNYSNDACNINFNQTSGNATTNCCILGGDAGIDNTINICDSDPIFNMENQLLGTPDNGGNWYNSSWLPVTNQFNPSLSSSGTYTYIVTGSPSSCPDDTSYLSVNVVQSPLVNLPIFSSVCDDASSILFNSGTPIGGTYSINGNISSSFVPSISNIGNNTITYSYYDLNGCYGTDSQILSVNQSPVSTVITSNISCNGFSDGSASLLISGGTPNYNTNWGGFNPNALSAGTYGYVVTDTNGCTFSDSCIIYEPQGFSINVITTDVNCNGQNDGTAVVKIQGTSTPVGTISNLTYCNSEPGSDSYSNIEEVQLFGDNVNINNNTSGNCDKYEDYTPTMYADITEGQSYNIDITLGDCNNFNYPSGAKVYIDWNIDGDFNDLGEEVGTVPYGVSSSATIPITVPFTGVHGATRMRVVAQYISTQDISLIDPCDIGVWAPSYLEPWFGATEDYSIVVTAASITATYIWSSGATTDSVSGLTAGPYSVDVIDGNGCVNSGFFNITEPNPIIVLENTNNINCNGGSDGSFTLNISGGITDYSVSTSSFTQNLTGGISTFTTPNTLSAANYIYTITDSNGCIYTDNITLTSPSPITVTEIINDVSCFGLTDANVNLIISGGIPSYTEDWGVYNAASLPMGTFSYSVTDNNSCIYTNTININEPNELLISSTQNNISTCGANDGNIDVTILGGTIPYSFSWSSGQNNEDINSLAAGTYTLTVTDANLCTNTLSVILTEPTTPILNYTQNNTSCNLGNDGSINLSVSAGIAPYQYNWSNSSTTPNIFNLSAGIYTVNVIDGNNCIVTENITITEPTAINVISTQTNVTNCNGNDGSIDISISGGTGSYTFLWSNGTTTEDVFNLNSGIHYVDINDINNCTYSFNFTINEPAGITTTENIINVNCYGENTGSVTLNIIGGQAPYIENWNGYNSTSLSSGNYSYTVTDNQNCNYNNTIIISEPNELIVTETINPVLCKNENTGNVILNISGGVTPFNQNWGGNNPLALQDGNYTYTVTDFNGCTFTNTVVITEPSLLTSNITTTDALCFGYNDGTATVNTTGGTTPYNINWFGQNNNALTNGSYSTLITDANGCTNTLNFTITEAPEIQVTTTITPVSCFGYTDGSVILNITGVSPPFTEDWMGQNPSILSDGIYNFTVTDNDGCIQQGITIINEPLEITTNEITSDVLCNGENNGTAFIQINGGTLPYSEDWNGANILQLTEGNYTYTITDANNCTFTDYVSINEPNIISVQETVIDAECFNTANGQAILNISGGTAPYFENWGTENPLTLTAGIYNYNVTDINSCSYSDSVQINQANQVFMNFNMETPICINDSSWININIINPLSTVYTIEVNDGINSSYLLTDSLGNNLINGKPFGFLPQISTLYTIISITDENGCSSPVNLSDSTIVYTLPDLTLDIPDFCTQDSSQILNQGTPKGGIYYIEGEQNNFLDIERLEIETYEIRYEYTDPITQCYNDISTEIMINESPTAEFAFGPKPVDIDNAEIDFENKSNFFNYQIWDLGDGTTIVNQNEFSHIFSDTGIFTTKLYIENTYGCVDSIEYDVIIYPVFDIHIPSAFTPNDDGKNDTFGPTLREGGYTNFQMKIYNQWGQLIFNEENEFWKGTLNNKICQNGVYTYKISIFDFVNKLHSRKGNFILIK